MYEFVGVALHSLPCTCASFYGGGGNDPDPGEGLTRAEIPMPGEKNKNESEKNSMRILLTGDSITDMFRDRNTDFGAMSYGVSYPYQIQAELGTCYPGKYEILNRGISGNRVVDLYARIKSDCWNLSPDVVSVLIGINDVWHEIMSRNGVELDRYEKVYRAFIEDTQKALPGVKFMLMEPFVLHGTATDGHYREFLYVKEYAGVVRRLAEEYGAVFVPLQEAFDRAAERNGADWYLYDGVHPTVVGAKLIADEWLKAFRGISG